MIFIPTEKRILFLEGFYTLLLDFCVLETVRIQHCWGTDSAFVGYGFSICETFVRIIAGSFVFSFYFELHNKNNIHSNLLGDEKNRNILVL